jgi:hypothetical protein
MSIQGNLRVLVVGLASAGALLGQIDAREIIRYAVAADELNWRTARNYTFEQRVELRHLDFLGRVKSSEAKTFQVTLPGGTPFRQLVLRDDRPLPSAEAKKEREGLAKSIAERRKETEPERAKRLSVYEMRPDWVREAWQELPDAFDFRLAGDGLLEGRKVFIIEATPRLGFEPKSRTAKMFRSIRGTFWVDQQNHQMVRLDAEVTDTIAVGLFLVRIAKGSRAILELTRVSEGIWLPDSLQVFASARLGLLQALRIEQRVQYSRYSIVPDPTGGREARRAGLSPVTKAASQ